jgi:hypothetical protein
VSCDPHSGHCVTCADEASELEVVALQGDGIARCLAPDGAEVDVMTDLVGQVACGDRLLVHAGTALARLEQPA